MGLCLLRSQQGASACFSNRPPGGLTCRRCSLTSAKELVVVVVGVGGPRGSTAYLSLEAIFNWNPELLNVNDGSKDTEEKIIQMEFKKKQNSTK